MELRTQEGLTLESFKSKKIVQEMLTRIQMALEGNPIFFKSHPDYILSADKKGYVGTFPNNIRRCVWLHIGFQDSFRGGYPCDEPEVFGIVELAHGHYVSFCYTADEPGGVRYVNGAVAESVGPLLENLRLFASEIVQKYVQETVLTTPRIPLLRPIPLRPVDKTVVSSVSVSPILMSFECFLCHRISEGEGNDPFPFGELDSGGPRCCDKCLSEKVRGGMNWLASVE